MYDPHCDCGRLLTERMNGVCDTCWCDRHLLQPPDDPIVVLRDATACPHYENVDAALHSGCSWCAHMEEIGLPAALDAVVKFRDALKWYAERRNYVPAAPPAVAAPKYLIETDGWDGQGPGARARAALALFPTDTEETA